MKVSFSRKAKAKAALPKIESFLEDSAKAYDYWQENRGEGEPEKFWNGMKKKFPKTFRYLVELSKPKGDDGLMRPNPIEIGGGYSDET